MQYVHVKNIEKFHPGYKDRTLQFAKIFINMADGDPDCEKLHELDWGRFIKLILLELRAQNPLPNQDWFWTKKGIDIKKRPMSLTLEMLHSFVDIVTEDEKECNTEKEKEEDKEKEKEEDKETQVYQDFEKAVFKDWNDFCNKHAGLAAVREITVSRRLKLKKRYSGASFKNFKDILVAAESQPFLFGENDRKWVINFDWLIENDLNHIKVLERRYKSKGNKIIPENIQRFMKPEKESK